MLLEEENKDYDEAEEGKWPHRDPQKLIIDMTQRDKQVINYVKEEKAAEVEEEKYKSCN